MSKFSEIPYYILEDFLGGQTVYSSDPAPAVLSARLNGLRRNIVAAHSYGFDVYLQTVDGFYKLNLTYAGMDTRYTEYDLISFALNETTYSNSLLTINVTGGFVNTITSEVETTPDGAKLYFHIGGADDVYTAYADIPSASWSTYAGQALYSKHTKSDINISDILEHDYHGCDIYFRKDSSFFDFVNNYNTTTHGEYNNGNINTNQDFIYLGKLDSIDNDKIIVKYNGYKTYAYAAVPYSAKNANFKVFMDTFFDRLYMAQYNLFKNILKMSDPHEVNADFLYYIASMSAMTVPTIISEDKQREFVAALPELLKRKGTYYSLYVIWKILTSSTNHLNVYERWNPWPVPGRAITVTGEPFGTGTEIYGFPDGYPIETFKDSLYVFNPIYDWDWFVRTGAGTYYYQSIYDVKYVIEFPNVAVTWVAEHNILKQYPFVQCWNSLNESVIPDSITFTDSTKLTADYGTTTVKGKAVVFPSQGAEYEYTHTQATTATSWVITHSLSGKFTESTKYPLITIVNDNDEMIIPDEITFTDGDTITLNFSEGVSGLAYVGLTDNRYFHSQTTPAMDWNINHNLNTRAVIVQIVDENGTVMYPDEIKIINPNKIKVQFYHDTVIGTACVYTYAQTTLPYITYGSDEYFLSPHYIVEMDLSNEPFGDDYIINEELLDELRARWEDMRPACKYAHYRELISPVSDFSGNEVSLYNETTMDGFLYSKYVKKSYSKEDDNVYGQDVTYATSHWYFRHRFGNQYPFIQCFNTDWEVILPYDVDFTNTNSLGVDWDDVVVKGYGVLLLPENTDITTQTISGDSSASITHALSMNYPLVQVIDNSYNLLIPNTITYVPSASRVDIDFGGECESGIIVLGVPTYYYTETVTAASDTWSITHPLNTTNVIVQVINDDNVVIYPEMITIVDGNTVKVEFEESMTGKIYIFTDINLNNIRFGDFSNDSETWTVTHNLDYQYPFVQCWTEAEFIIPETMTFVDDKSLEVTWAGSGLCARIVTLPPRIGSLYYTEEFTNDDTLYIQHNLGFQYPLVYVVDSNSNMIMPYEVTFTDENNILIDFDENVSGTVVIGVPTYHYNETISVASDTWNITHNLNTEDMIVQVVNGSNELIIPATITITDNNNIQLTFGEAVTGKVYIFTTHKSTYVHYNYRYSTTWTITHNLDVEHPIVQCFDFSGNLLTPTSIFNSSDNVSVVTFDNPYSGFATCCYPDAIQSFETSAGWTFEHDLSDVNLGDLVIQQVETNDTVFVPASATLLSEDDIRYVLSTPVSGNAYAITSDYEETCSETLTAGETWTISHMLDSVGIQLQFFDEYNNIIYPVTCQILDENTVSATFDSEVTPKVAIRKIGLATLETDSIFDSMSYIKVGAGGSDYWNPLFENDLHTPYSEKYEITKPEYDDSDYYYVKAEIPNILYGHPQEEMNITEIGIFDSDDNILFYTRCSEIYKSEDVDLVIWYKIKRTLLI